MIKYLCFIAAAALAAGAPAGAQTAATASGTMPSCAAGDPVVWENTKSKAYHMQGDAYYGTTKHGKYACKSAADSTGFHAAGSSAKSPAMHGAATSPMPMSAGVAASPMPGTHSRHHRHRGTMPSPEPSPT